ncbi:MAG: hypothetical protein NT062_36265 [Proteobacteria bacterium]|nr:hypothetical protein [Pseudomonadota bacterium]
MVPGDRTRRGSAARPWARDRDAQYFALACACGFFGAGCSLRAGDGYREIATVMTPDQRQRLVGEITFGTALNADIVNKRAVQVPGLWGAWWFADLIPTAETAAAMVADIVRWDKRPKPVPQALAVIEKVGAVCIPFLDAAIAATPKPPQHKVLVAARKLFEGSTRKGGELARTKT